MLATTSHIITTIVTMIVFIVSPFSMRYGFKRFLDSVAIVDIVIYFFVAAFSFGVFATESAIIAARLIHGI